MKPNWDKILTELSVKVRDGIPDLTNEQHLIKLWDVLREQKWNLESRVELIKTLTEQKEVTAVAGAATEAGKKFLKAVGL